MQISNRLAKFVLCKLNKRVDHMGSNKIQSGWEFSIAIYMDEANFLKDVPTDFAVRLYLWYQI